MIQNKEIYEVEADEYKSFLRQLYVEDMVTKEENDEIFVYEKDNNTLICSRTKEEQNYIYNYPSRLKEVVPVRRIVLNEEETELFFKALCGRREKND